MVLIYDGLFQDPRVKQLDAPTGVFWIALIGLCSSIEEDTVTLDELVDWLEPRDDFKGELDTLLATLVSADLIRHNDDGTIHVLGRLDLWAYDSESDFG